MPYNNEDIELVNIHTNPDDSDLLKESNLPKRDHNRVLRALADLADTTGDTIGFTKKPGIGTLTAIAENGLYNATNNILGQTQFAQNHPTFVNGLVDAGRTALNGAAIAKMGQAFLNASLPMKLASLAVTGYINGMDRFSSAMLGEEGKKKLYEDYLNSDNLTEQGLFDLRNK